MDVLKATLSKPPLLPIQFNEYCDILGGQSWQEFITQISDSQQRNRIKSLAKLKLFMLSHHRYLYAEKNHYRLGLEKLYLKLSVVSQLCRLVRNSHRLLQKEMGAINPHTVRIGLASANTLVPAYWNYKIAFGEIDENQFIYEAAVGVYAWPWTTRAANDPRVDLYSLGMMLFRAVLVNGEQEFEKVHPIISQLVDILHVEFPNNSSASIEKKLLFRLNQLISDDILIPIRMLNSDFRKFVNQADWMKILVIGFRLVTQITGFSYGDLSRYKDENKWSVTDEVLNDIEKVTNEIQQSMLTEPIEMNADLASIVSELVADSNWISELCSDKNDENNRIDYTNILDEIDNKDGMEKITGAGSAYQFVTTLENASPSMKDIDGNDRGLSTRDKEKNIYRRIKEAGVLNESLSKAALNLEETLVQSSQSHRENRLNSNVNVSSPALHNSSFQFTQIGSQEINGDADKLKETLIQKPK